jgi:hypothetical protein
MNRSTNPDPEVEKWALPRRDFLVLGSVAVLGAAATSVTASTLRVVATPAEGAVLSIGYSEHVEPVTTDPGVSATGPVASAKTLRGNGNRFDNGARVTIHGISRRDERPVSIYVSAYAPVAAAPVPFVAWVHTANGKGLTNTGARTSFVAALDKDHTLPISVERRVPASHRFSRLLSAEPVPDALPVLASLEQSGGVCRLSHPGTYFIALRESMFDRQPDWSSIVVDKTANDASTALLQHGRSVDFDYIAITVADPTV